MLILIANIFIAFRSRVKRTITFCMSIDKFSVVWTLVCEPGNNCIIIMCGRTSGVCRVACGVWRVRVARGVSRRRPMLPVRADTHWPGTTPRYFVAWPCLLLFLFKPHLWHNTFWYGYSLLAYFYVKLKMVVTYL